MKIFPIGTDQYRSLQCAKLSPPQKMLIHGKISSGSAVSERDKGNDKEISRKGPMKKASQLYFYRRRGKYIPRVAAVHDLCGYGKCSLGVAIPVLSAAGIDVCPVPTSLFSSHTHYRPFEMLDTSSFLEKYIEAWKAIGVDLDGIYSGFLGSPDQVAIIQKLYETYPKALRIVDPVMGDNGKKYTTYTDSLCDAMRKLCQGADLLTPNLTEASILTGLPYPGQSPKDQEIEEMISALNTLGAKSVILKGILREGMITNMIAGEGIETKALTNGHLPYALHGTGDLYASALTAAVFAGKDLYGAATFAGRFVFNAINHTLCQPEFEDRGISFELNLKEVASLLDDCFESEGTGDFDGYLNGNGNVSH